MKNNNYKIYYNKTYREINNQKNKMMNYKKK